MTGATFFSIWCRKCPGLSVGTPIVPRSKWRSRTLAPSRSRTMFGSPQAGGGAAPGVRRQVPPDQPEDPSHQVLGRPGGEGDPPARLEDPQHLLDGDVRARGEHVAELAENQVERGIAVRHRLHVALDVVDLHPGNAGVELPSCEEDGREIEAPSPGRPGAPQ